VSERALHRVFDAAGAPAPPTRGSRGQLAKAIARCPRERLVRVVAWYVHERARGRHDESVLLEGVRALVRGWTDWYEVDAPPPFAKAARSLLPPTPGSAVMIRTARWGSGWVKPAVPFVGPSRATLEEAVDVLEARVGCLLHDDCIEEPELALACWLDRK
jgi:hypothetical protein